MKCMLQYLIIISNCAKFRKILSEVFSSLVSDKIIGYIVVISRYCIRVKKVAVKWSLCNLPGKEFFQVISVFASIKLDSNLA